MPGLLLCFVLRYDAYKKATLVCQMGQVPGPRSMVSIYVLSDRIHVLTRSVLTSRYLV